MASEYTGLPQDHPLLSDPQNKRAHDLMVAMVNALHEDNARQTAADLNAELTAVQHLGQATRNMAAFAVAMVGMLPDGEME